MAGYIGNKSSVVSSGAERKFKFTITETTTTLSNLAYTRDLVHVFHNGVRLVDGTDYTATNGTSITLTNAAENGDEVVVISYASFQPSDTVSASLGGFFEGNVTINADLTVSGNTDINGGTIDGTVIGGSTPAAISGTTGQFGTITSDGLTVGTAVYPTSGPLSNRNKIINGAMVIDQRNAGAAVTASANDKYFALDRFVAFGQDTDGVFTIQRSGTSPKNFVNSALITVTTADASLGATQYYLFGQNIEGYNTADLNWGSSSAQAVTLSFWARSSLSGTFGGAVTNSAQDRCYPFTYTISAADNWEYKTVTIEGDTSGTWLTTNGIGIRLFFDLGVGSTYRGTAGAWAGATYLGATGATDVISTLNATWQITGVQLEAGDTATPFEHRSYGQELALCQRYFQKNPRGTLVGIHPGQAMFDHKAMVPFRATPSVALSSTSPYVESIPWNALGSLTGAYTSNGHMGVYGGDVVLYGTYSPSIANGDVWEIGEAVFLFSAEL